MAVVSHTESVRFLCEFLTLTLALELSVYKNES